MALNVSVRYLFKASGSNVAKRSGAVEPLQWGPYCKVSCKICLKGRMSPVYKIHNVSVLVPWNARYVYAQTAQLKDKPFGEPQHPPVRSCTADSYRWRCRLCSSHTRPRACCITHINTVGLLRSVTGTYERLYWDQWRPRPAALYSAVKKQT